MLIWTSEFLISYYYEY